MNSTGSSHRKRVFSGAQPSGKLHIGNYFGALKRWVAEQEVKDSYFCIVDLHAITVPQDPVDLRRRIYETAAIYLAAGLDPEKSTIYVQSHVPPHAELCWILNCVTPIGWLERMTQYKTKAAEQESVNTGLLDYPVLQAADILLFDADEVPIGEDQKQHVELTRDIAQRFNHIYGDTFVLPEPVIARNGGRIRALNDPSKKMSKSLAHIRGHAIGLVDTPDEIRETIKTAVTDSGREIAFSDAPEKAGVNNLLEIYALLTGSSQAEIESHFARGGYGQLKKEVAEALVEGLRPVRERYLQLVAAPDELDVLLAQGAQKASLAAGKKLALVQEKVGFIPLKKPHSG